MLRITQKIIYTVVVLSIVLTGCASVPNEPPENYKISKPSIGVVFLHAKWSAPHTVKVAPLVDEMRSAGMWVVQPEMPWSRNRNYNASYGDAMLEIHNAVKTMRNRGVAVVFVGGHSFGANAAIGYAARYSDIDGVIAVAPGHLPDINARGNLYGDSVDRAEQMIKEHREDELADFIDTNQKKKAIVRMSAKNYVSYFKPNGQAVIPLNISKMNKNTALFWVVGEKDKVSWMGKHYAYNKAPFNQLNEYLETSGGHRQTSIIAKHEIVEWIKKVAQSND